MICDLHIFLYKDSWHCYIFKPQSYYHSAQKVTEPRHVYLSQCQLEHGTGCFFEAGILNFYNIVCVILSVLYLKSRNPILIPKLEKKWVF